MSKKLLLSLVFAIFAVVGTVTGSVFLTGCNNLQNAGGGTFQPPTESGDLNPTPEEPESPENPEEDAEIGVNNTRHYFTVKVMLRTSATNYIIASQSNNRDSAGDAGYFTLKKWNREHGVTGWTYYDMYGATNRTAVNESDVIKNAKFFYRHCEYSKNYWEVMEVFPNNNGYISADCFGVHGSWISEHDGNPPDNSSYRYVDNTSKFLYTTTASNYDNATVSTSWETAKNACTTRLYGAYFIVFRQKFTITYNANGGSGSQASQTLYAGVGKTINPACTFTKVGSTFNGWSKTSWTDDEANGNATVNATWVTNSYNININILNPNGGEDLKSGTITLQYYNNAGSLTATYTDVNNEPSDPSVQYGGKIKISNITPANGMYFKNITSRKTSFSQIDGGSVNGVSLPQSYVYTFDYTDFSTDIGGWCDTITIQMEWYNYSLTVAPNGGVWEGSGSNRSYTQACTSTKTISNPTRNGYTFTGWSLSGAGSISGTTFTYGAGNATLTARWTANQYNVSFDYNYTNAPNVNLFNPTNISGLWIGAVASQTADRITYTASATTNDSANRFDNVKIQKWNNGSYIEERNTNVSGVYLTYTFTKDSAMTILRIGFNGSREDFCLEYNVSYLPNGTYTVSLYVDSFTSTGGSFSQLKIEAGSERTEYTPYERRVTYNNSYATYTALPTSTRDGYVFNGWKRKVNRLDMDDLMEYFNSFNPNNKVLKEADGSFSWCADSAYGTDYRIYSVSLVQGGTYRLSYTARSSKNGSEKTTSLTPRKKDNSDWYGNGYSDCYVIRDTVWRKYSTTFTVDSTFGGFSLGNWNSERTYFKNIRLERIDIDDFENTTITSTSTMNVDSDHTLYAQWTPSYSTINFQVMTKSKNSNGYVASNMGGDITQVSYFKSVNNESVLTTTSSIGSIQALIKHFVKLSIEPKTEFFKFRGIGTSSTSPTIENLFYVPSTSSMETIYVFFEELSQNLLKYDSEEKYFYFEDGEYPQTYVGDELNEILTNNITAGTTVLYTLTYTTQEGDKEVPVYEYEGQKYAKVTKGNNTAWFKVEPIRWRVSGYGVEPTATPMGFDGAGVTKENFTVVSDKILGASVYTNQKTQEGWNSTSSEMWRGIEEINTVLQEQNVLKYGVGREISTDRFSEIGNHTVVQRTNVTYNGIRVASEEEIKNAYADMRAKYTDFSAFLLGKTSGANGEYWTRDLGNDLGEGQYIASYGLVSSRYLDKMQGLRFSMTMGEGVRLY